MRSSDRPLALAVDGPDQLRRSGILLQSAPPVAARRRCESPEFHLFRHAPLLALSELGKLIIDCARPD